MDEKNYDRRKNRRKKIDGANRRPGLGYDSSAKKIERDETGRKMKDSIDRKEMKVKHCLCTVLISVCVFNNKKNILLVRFIAVRKSRESEKEREETRVFASAHT